jgi:hypothetical protein
MAPPTPIDGVRVMKSSLDSCYHASVSLGLRSMARQRKYGTSFSWRRATGVSATKGKISRAIGVPLTRSGRQRKTGQFVEKYIAPIFLLAVLAMVGKCMAGN